MPSVVVEMANDRSGNDMPRQPMCVGIVALLGMSWFAAQNVAAQPVPPAPLIDHETQAVISSGLRWLSERQHANGSFGVTGAYAKNVGVTSICGLAFLSSGSVPAAGPYSREVSMCLDYVLSCAQPDGFFADEGQPAHGPMYGHGFATMFLSQMIGMTARDDLRPAIRRAVNLIITSQNSQGGWRYQPIPDEADLTMTVCQLMALHAAVEAGFAVPQSTIDRAIEYVTQCQNTDGGFRYRLFDPAESSLARTSAAVVVVTLSKGHQSPVVDNGLRYLQRHARHDAAQEYRYYTEYYQMLALQQLPKEQWETAYRSHRDRLVASRTVEHWSDRFIGDEYATAMVLIALQVPRQHVPIFCR